MKRSSLTRPRKGFWTCRRQRNGVKCGSLNPNRKQKCMACGGAKPAKSKPKHMAALEATYEEYIVLNGGEFCGVCKRRRHDLPAPERKLDRDHCHGTSRPRGLLCRKCNRNLKQWMEPWWLRAAADYLERSNAE